MSKSLVQTFFLTYFVKQINKRYFNKSQYLTIHDPSGIRTIIYNELKNACDQNI